MTDDKSNSELLFTKPDEQVSGTETLVESSDENPYGDSNVEELKQVVAASFGDKVDLDADAVSIAVESLAKAIRNRKINHSSSDPNSLAIFVVSDRPRNIAEKINAQNVPIMDDGSQQLTGNIWIISPNVRSGWAINSEQMTPANAFKFVNDKGIGNNPTFVFNPGAVNLEIRFYQKGLSNPDNVQSYPFFISDFDLEKLDSVITHHYEGILITPDAISEKGNPWKNSSKFFPLEKTEAHFQFILKVALTIGFPSMIIKHETSGTEGRCDLWIISKSSENTFISHAALELKVLRSFYSTGNPVTPSVRAQAVVDGVQQAIAYKRESNAQIGMVCCFDMTKPDDCDENCFSVAKDLIDEFEIYPRRYRIYNSSKALREDRNNSSPS